MHAEGRASALDGLLEQERLLLHDLDSTAQGTLADLLRTVVAPFDAPPR